jgi:beta-1,4-mannosyl-glycoprotein beta-1,4-N-acetylglucosaminyltransferase
MRYILLLLQTIIPRPGQEHHLVGAEVVVYDSDRPKHLLDLFHSPLTSHTIDMAALMRREPNSAFKITDTVLYNGDLIALTRIKYLFDVIDEFIIVESWFTFSGQVKSHLFFHEPSIYTQFLPYMHKIKYIVIKFMPEVPPTYAGPQFNFAKGTKDSWWRETYARSYFKFFIRPCSNGEVDAPPDAPPDMYLVCDCDEIPDREVLIQFRSFGAGEVNIDRPLHFDMNFFYYNLQWLFKTRWSPPYMVSAKGLFQLPDISYPRYTGGGTVGHGWHCSYFMSIEKMIQKIEAFSHQELNTDANKNSEHIKNCLRHGLDIYSRPPENWDGFVPKLTDEYIAQNVPPELYAFHLEVLALQPID